MKNAAQLRQADIVAATGISQSYLSEIMSRKKTPSTDIAAQLEAATGKHRLYWLYPGEYDEAGKPTPQRAVTHS